MKWKIKFLLFQSTLSPKETHGFSLCLCPYPYTEYLYKLKLFYGKDFLLAIKMDSNSDSYRTRFTFPLNRTLTPESPFQNMFIPLKEVVKIMKNMLRRSFSITRIELSFFLYLLFKLPSCIIFSDPVWHNFSP